MGFIFGVQLLHPEQQGTEVEDAVFQRMKLAVDEVTADEQRALPVGTGTSCEVGRDFAKDDAGDVEG